MSICGRRSVNFIDIMQKKYTKSLLSNKCAIVYTSRAQVHLATRQEEEEDRSYTKKMKILIECVVRLNV